MIQFGAGKEIDYHVVVGLYKTLELLGIGSLDVHHYLRVCIYVLGVFELALRVQP